MRKLLTACLLLAGIIGPCSNAQIRTDFSGQMGLNPLLVNTPVGAAGRVWFVSVPAGAGGITLAIMNRDTSVGNTFNLGILTVNYTAQTSSANVLNCFVTPNTIATSGNSFNGSTSQTLGTQSMLSYGCASPPNGKLQIIITPTAANTAMDVFLYIASGPAQNMPTVIAGTSVGGGNPAGVIAVPRINADGAAYAGDALATPGQLRTSVSAGNGATFEASNGTTPPLGIFLVSQDLCASGDPLKKSVAISVGSATTTQLVAISGSTSIHVCGWTMNVTGTTAPTVQLEYGTGASCGTGTTTLTGVAGGAAAGFVFQSAGGGYDIVFTPAAQALCLVTGGTAPSAQGVLTYIQQ